MGEIQRSLSCAPVISQVTLQKYQPSNEKRSVSHCGWDVFRQKQRNVSLFLEASFIRSWEIVLMLLVLSELIWNLYYMQICSKYSIVLIFFSRMGQN